MKLFKKREKLSTGVTCLCEGDGRLFVGSVDEGLWALDPDYAHVQKMRVELGTVDAQFRAGSKFTRTGRQFFRQRVASFRSLKFS